MKRTGIIGLALACCVAMTAGARAEEAAIVANVKVLSDKVPDVSSLDAWKKSFIKDGMSDKEKALAVWKTVATFQHQDDPPLEFLQNEGTVYDAIKMFNVYGYSFCGVASCEMTSLARYAGLQARVRTINAHVVPEIFFDGKWHLLDASLITYYLNTDGEIAGIDDVEKGVQDWLKDHPDMKGKDAALRKFQADNGWQGWKNGPAILASCPLYDGNGWLPAHTHGWYSNMQEYDGSHNTPFNYEAGYSMGYKVNVELRPGETLTRNWSNKGLFANMDGTGGAPGCMKGKVGEGSLTYSATRFGDIAPGRVGNGTEQYTVPLADPLLEKNAWRYDNLQVSGNTLAAKDATKPAILEIRNPTSYVYLTGHVKLNATVGDGGKMGVLYSDNNGLDWKDVATVDKSGEQDLDIGKLVIRKYDYRLRLVLQGQGTALSALSFTHDIQQSQRPLPALGQGDNTITFSAGPQDGTITIEGATMPEFNKGRNLMYTDFHPVLENIASDKLLVQGDTGSVTYDVATPGDMTRMNILTHYRARGKNSGWDVQVSYDGGKTFNSVSKAMGSTAATGNYVVVSDIPAGTKAAKVRWLAQGGDAAVMIFNLRVDADYKLPNSGFRPVKVTYLWEEGGIPKSDEHIAKSASETYTIHCDAKPTMKSLVVELAK